MVIFSCYYILKKKIGSPFVQIRNYHMNVIELSTIMLLCKVVVATILNTTTTSKKRKRLASENWILYHNDNW